MDEQASVPVPQANTIALSTPRPLKIIVVNEDSVEAAIVMTWLKHMGHLSRHVESGVKAINAVSMYGCDVMLMHYRLPLLDGAETAKLLTKFNRGGPHVEIIGLLDETNPVLETHCLDSGMRMTLTLPLSEEHLAAAIGQIEMRLLRP